MASSSFSFANRQKFPARAGESRGETPETGKYPAGLPKTRMLTPRI